MQSLNLVKSRSVEFNAFRIYDHQDKQDNVRRLALVEQLQTTLDLTQLLEIYAREATKYVDFSGLYFKNGDISTEINGSRAAKSERQFDLKLHDQYIGTLTYTINRPISITNFKILEQLHQSLIHPLNNAISYHKAMILALEDGLTGLGNRRAFDQQLKRALHHANRNQSRIGLILGDLNKFKSLNDTYGHQVGDDVLVQFSKALCSSIRDSDSVFRFGGDEFAIIVEDASINSLNVIENRLCSAISQDALLSKYKVTSSLGLTFMNRSDDEKSLFERADTLLYRNKVNMHRQLSIV